MAGLLDAPIDGNGERPTGTTVKAAARSSAGLRVRGFEPADAAAVYQIRRLAFGGPRDTDPNWANKEAGWSGLVAELDSRPVGFLRFWWHRQYFGGRAVPMAGLASVSVASHARGAGVASELLTVAIERMRDEGFALSALFPSASAIYRSRGWERVGVRQWLELPVDRLPRRPRGVTRPATESDVPSMLAAYRAVARTVDGMLDRATTAFDADEFFNMDIADLVPGDFGVDGYLMADRPDGSQLIAQELVAVNMPAAEALLNQMGSWSGLLDTVTLQVLDPMVHELLLSLPSRHLVCTQPWMLRIIDLPVAVEARGWPHALALRPLVVDIEVDDEIAPWQSGRFRLICEDGAVRCEPGGYGAVRFTARGLAAWFAGAATSATLFRAGLIDGDQHAGNSLDALTGAPRSLHLADFF